MKPFSFVIIGLLTLAAYPAYKFVFGSPCSSRPNSRAQSDLTTLHSACESYKIATGRYPYELEELSSHIDFFVDDKLPRDPWDNSYHYRLTETAIGPKPRIVCMGADCVIGTEDDIVSPKTWK